MKRSEIRGQVYPLVTEPRIALRSIRATQLHLHSPSTIQGLQFSLA
jgi:hypothetical protein